MYLVWRIFNLATSFFASKNCILLATAIILTLSLVSCQSYDDDLELSEIPGQASVRYDGQTWRSYEAGVASWYGDGFYFKRTANGEMFLPGEYFTAAHKYLPLGTFVIVKNKLNNKAVLVNINDRGPFVKGRVIDLSLNAAKKLEITREGTAPVVIYVKKSHLTQEFEED